MLPDSKWLIFIKQLRKTGAVTDVYHLYNKADTNTVIAVIKWLPAWRKYCLFPAPQTIFEIDCLKDITLFLRHVQQERLNAREKAFAEKRETGI